MWTENTTFFSGSALRMVAALSRMMCCQSWPQPGASTTMVWVRPALRSRVIAVVVSLTYRALVVSLFPNGSLPRLMMTWSSVPTRTSLRLIQ